MQLDYDVVVVGAGPGGLGVAAELSKELKVLVVDKRRDHRTAASLFATVPKNDINIHEPTNTTKSWFVPHESLYFNDDLVSRRGKYGVARFLAKTFSGKSKGNENGYDLVWDAKLFGKADLFDRYPYIDENLLFDHWRDMIEGSETGSRMVFNHFYRDHKVSEECVTVSFLRPKTHGQPIDTEEFKTTCKVLLDASGVESEILKAYEMQPHKFYWWSVFGCIAKHPEGAIGLDRDGPERLKVGDYMLWQTFESTNIDRETSVRRGRPIFEYEILDEHKSFPMILFLRREKMTLDYMRAEFMDILRNEPSTKDFHDVEVEEMKYGWYPSAGRNLRASRDRVDFIGDSGSWTTPCGWGMGFILENYKPYAKGLTKLVRSDALDRKSLEGLVKLKSYQKTQFLLNKLVTHFLANGTATQLDKFIDIFNKIDPILCEKTFALRIAPHEVFKTLRAAKNLFSLRELYRIVPQQEHWSITKDLLRLGIELVPHLLYRAWHGRWRDRKRDFRVY